MLSNLFCLTDEQLERPKPSFQKSRRYAERALNAKEKEQVEP